MKILDEIDSLSKINIEESDDDGILSFMYEFASRVTDFLGIERINIWLLNKDKNAIFSIAEYDKRDNSFNHHTWLYEKDVPHYFQHLKEDKIILAPNIHTHPATYEFSDNYAKQYNIISLTDVPLRLNGQLIGVMCFEKTGDEPRVFNEMEQTFAISLAQLAVSYIENAKRRKIQKKLEDALREKELVIKELHHRVKNNFSVLVSLLRLSKDNVQKNQDEIFETIEHQVFSMLKVHELLLESNTYDAVDLNEYLKKISEEFKASYPELITHFEFNIGLEKFEISPKVSVYLGLIITEIFLNALKYQVIPNNGVFKLSTKVKDNEVEIIAGDNGNNFDFNTSYNQKQSLGLSIINDLAESGNFEVYFPAKNNSFYRIVVKK